MSKEDHACKVTAVCKHKERKPKKPHYIPRPWGKPYNYKCFQCPFTCMEKSHLYNHMKYSLCKNSLSLLIESDWPYKKGNLLHPLQQQQAHCLRNAPAKEEPGADTTAEERPRPRQAPGVDGEDEGESQGGEEEDEEEVGGGGGGGGGQLGRSEVTGIIQDRSNGTRDPQDGGGRARRAEPERLLADVFSLEQQLLRARSVEAEAQLKHYKLSKPCLAAPGPLPEHWRLLSTSQAKAKEASQHPHPHPHPRAGGSSVPSCPPPPGLLDYPQDLPPPGLSLSVLGVGYPLSPGLFSYINSALPSAAATMAGSAHAQLAQLPFLASAAHLMHHPAAGGAASAYPHADRGALLPPRLYYPFLCEHAFGAAAAAVAQGDITKGLKTSCSSSSSSSSALERSSPPPPPTSYQPKVSLWKVPALRLGAAAASPPPWGSPSPSPAPQRESPDPGQGSRGPGERSPGAAREGRPSWALKRMGACLGNPEVPPQEKKPALGQLTLDLLNNIHSNTMATDRLLLHSSFQSAQPQPRPVEPWYRGPPSSPGSGSPSPPHCVRPSSRDPTTGRGARGGRASAESAALLSDLSKALQEYQEAERKVSRLGRDAPPGPAAQGHLWEHLHKIRSELSHIHQALEQTAHHSEGPLDLSIRKDPHPARGTEAVATGEEDVATGDGGLKDDITTETEEEEEEEEEVGEEEGREEREEEEERERERKAMKASLESRKQSLDVLIKMSQGGMSAVKTEGLAPPPGGLALRPSPADALWAGRTTKCEADSSVLLCPDGRPVVFSVPVPPTSKASKRPPPNQTPPHPDPH